jgi:N-acetylglutamate synthase-like GNAT family acetyltransferase
VALSALNRQLWLLARVVLHPTYRGAGIAAAFVRRACQTCPVDWIETLSAMGQVNPFFERAGFVRVGVIRKDKKRSGHGRIYGRRGVRVSAETAAKSRFSEPVYYVFDNRRRDRKAVSDASPRLR